MATIRKRGCKFQVQVRRVGQRSVTKSFNNKRDADIWARQTEVLIDRNSLPTDTTIIKNMTVGCLVRRYLEEITPNKKTAMNERYVLKAFLKTKLSQMFLSQVTSSDIAHYRDVRLKSISPAGLKRELVPIRNMFEIARDEWGIPIKENPLSKLKLKGTDNRRERRLKEGEYQKLIQAAETRKNPWIKKVILFAIQTGMRRGEILALHWDQVDLKRQSVTILESKNGYSRTIPINPSTVALLHCFRGVPGASDTRVFPSKYNKDGMGENAEGYRH
jgi:integrase